MSISQFLQLLWARRLLIVATTVSCLLGAFVVVQIVPPRYEAKARVMFDIFKPDPTGERPGGRELKLYISSQSELIKDYRVTRKVVEELGWLGDPNVVAAYRRSGATVDFPRWTAQQVADRIETSMVFGTNIMEIRYSSPTQRDASIVAETIRKAYIEATLEDRRESAARSAGWLEKQAATERAELLQAQLAKAAYERKTGVVLPDGQNDIETTRLQALASSSAGVVVAPQAPIAANSGSASLELLDAQLAQARANLGPNHPDRIALEARRQALASQIAREQAAARNAAAAAAGGIGAINRAVEETKARVIASREVVEQMRQLQADVDARRRQFESTTQRATQFRQEAAAADSGIETLGIATAPRSPTFPNKPLIMIGALIGGLGVGLGVSLLIELMARRVRCFEDLQAEFDVPVLAVIRADTARHRRGGVEVSVEGPLKRGLGRAAG